jgi:hypothetical protein
MTDNRLSRLVTRVEFLSDQDAQQVIRQLIEREGATHRFIGGTYELRLAGVAGTAASGVAKTLLASWLRAAQRKLAKAGR